VLASTAGGWLYWICAVLLLATKEDAPIYLAAFALTMLLFPITDRRRCALTFAVALIWFAVALLIAIPSSRAAEGLSRENPLLAGRYGSPSGEVGWTVLGGRLASAGAITNLAQLAATTGGLSVAAPLWLLPALPGLVVNLAAEPSSMQASLTGHYAWPVLPWIFIAAGAGIAWVARRSRRLSIAWVGLLVVFTLADNPALRRLHTTEVSPEAKAVRQALASVTFERDSSALAQGNLIPHLPRSLRMFAAGDAGARPTARPRLVLLTDIGDTWPMTGEQIAAELKRYEVDPAYKSVGTDRLHIYALRNP
jgi:uncharacterized membrane protein